MSKVLKSLKVPRTNEWTSVVKHTVCFSFVMSSAAVMSDGSTDSLSVLRTLLTTDGVNGAVMVSSESFVLCAFREATDAESSGSGEGEDGS